MVSVHFLFCLKSLRSASCLHLEYTVKSPVCGDNMGGGVKTTRRISTKIQQTVFHAITDKTLGCVYDIYETLTGGAGSLCVLLYLF